MDRIQLRRDTAARWAQYNPVLLEGEVGYEIDTKLRKIGDGMRAWNDLPYLRAEGISQELGDDENSTVSQKKITEAINLITPEYVTEDWFDENKTANTLDPNKMYCTYEEDE